MHGTLRAAQRGRHTTQKQQQRGFPPGLDPPRPEPGGGRRGSSDGPSWRISCAFGKWGLVSSCPSPPGTYAGAGWAARLRASAHDPGAAQTRGPAAGDRARVHTSRVHLTEEWGSAPWHGISRGQACGFGGQEVASPGAIGTTWAGPGIGGQGRRETLTPGHGQRPQLAMQTPRSAHGRVRPRENEQRAGDRATRGRFLKNEPEARAAWPCSLYF